MLLEGQFTITHWQESEQQQFEDKSKFTSAYVQQEYTGSINGNSQIQYQMYYKPDGNAIFTGFESLTGTLNGNTIDLTLKHDGSFDNGVASSTFTIVNSSIEELIKCVGTFKSIEGGRANYNIS